MLRQIFSIVIHTQMPHSTITKDSHKQYHEHTHKQRVFFMQTLDDGGWTLRATITIFIYEL